MSMFRELYLIFESRIRQKRGLVNLFKKGVIVFLILALVYAIDSLHAKETTTNQASLSNEQVIAAEDSPSAKETTTVSASISPDAIFLGEKLIVRIIVEPNTMIAGMQFDLSFDPSLVSANNVEEGDLLSQNGAQAFFNPGIIDNESGTITGVYGVIIGPRQGVYAEGIFATITLTAGETKAISPITMSNVIVGDLKGNSVSVNVVNGKAVIDQN